MHVMTPSVPDDQPFVLSNLPPTPGQKRLALGIVLGLIVALYLVVGPFGGLQLGAIPSFVAVYTTGMFVTDWSPRSSCSPSSPFCGPAPSS